MNVSASAVHIAVLAELNPLEPIRSVPLVTLHLGAWDLVVSNHACMVLTATALLSLGIPLAMRAPKIVPGGFQNLVESICVFLREEMARPILGSLTDQYIGYVWTVFFFVLTLNLLAMIPTEKIVCLVTGRESHFGGAATANIWITGALGCVTFLMMNVYGVRRYGFFGYLAHLAPPSPGWLLPLIYPLELLSMFVRPFTLAIRLFANIIAGHLVLAIVLGLIFVFKNLGVALISIAACVALSFLELLVAFIQAYIFTFLSALYIGSSVSSEH